jgi:hypothetical protein
MKKITYSWIFAAMTLFLVSGCRSKKASITKKEESVSVIQQNDIQKSETAKVQKNVLRISDLKNLSLSPEDPEKELEVIFRGDTLKAKNASINFSHKQSSETDHSTAEHEKNESDNSLTDIDIDSDSKEKDVNVKSGSWGLNIGFILSAVVGVILLFVYFKTRSPP